MSNAPLMPMATAVWLVENTTLTFKQIANFCKLHEVEIQGIADGEVAKGIKAYNPIISGQLTREEIELSSKDENRPLEIKSEDIEISNSSSISSPVIIFGLKSSSSFSRVLLLLTLSKSISCFPVIERGIFNYNILDNLIVFKYKINLNYIFGMAIII